jgi:hypothetical protein
MLASPVWAQGGAAPYPAYGAPGGYPMAMQPAAMQPAAYAAYAGQPGGEASVMAPGGAPPAGMSPAPQMMMGAAPQMMGGYPPMQGAYPGAMAPDAYGAYGYVPADGGYGQPMGDPSMSMYGGNGGYAGPMGPMDGMCPYCGGAGCERCRGDGGGLLGGRLFDHDGLFADIFGCLLPYPDGGCGAPRWFDFAVDYMMLKRDNTGFNVPFTSLGITGPVVLSTNDLDFGSYKPGFRFQANVQLAAANSIEFTYFGQFSYNAVATVRNPAGALFSTVSQFGLIPFGGFTETDLSDFQQINYSSSLDSFEINWRNRWVAANARYQGSWTLGVRSVIVDEKLRYATSSSANGFLDPIRGFTPAQARFDTVTNNDLTGLQLGSDLWICLIPGFRLGGEVQAGVYGNHITTLNTIGVNDVAAPNNQFQEKIKDTNVAFVGQVNLMATYRLNYSWTLRGGYQFLYLSGLALATENFNPAPPALLFPAGSRQPLVHDSGNIFYHGWNVGLEYLW